MKKIAVFIISIVMSVCALSSVAYASDTIIRIDKAECKPGETVKVQMNISGNTGIAGAVLKLSYDNSLELLSVTKGDALSNLVFTPPAKMTTNPITLLWDGIESDTSNGTLVTLEFKTPDSVARKYNIEAKYDAGGIYDGDLNDLDVSIQNGYIDTIQKPEIAVSGDEELSISLTSPQAISGIVYTALYDGNGRLLEAESYDAASGIKAGFTDIGKGSYYKIMWWSDDMVPFCNAKVVDLIE